MAFTVEDFRDLLRLLEQHPEWQAELRRQLLTAELLELPALVRQLVEAQGRTEERLEALVEAQARTEGRLEALVEAQARTEERLGALATAQGRTEQRLEALASQVGSLVDQVSTLTSRVDDLRGEALEARYHRHFAAYFGRLARRLRLLDSAQLADLVEDALDGGKLSEEEADALRAADLVLAGRSPTDGTDLYLVVEVSFGIGLTDVDRAIERARLLERLGRPALPVVAGRWINSDAALMAQDLGVRTVVRGREASPSAA